MKIQCGFGNGARARLFFRSLRTYPAYRSFTLRLSKIAKMEASYKRACRIPIDRCLNASASQNLNAWWNARPWPVGTRWVGRWKCCFSVFSLLDMSQNRRRMNIIELFCVNRSIHLSLLATSLSLKSITQTPRAVLQCQPAQRLHPSTSQLHLQPRLQLPTQQTRSQTPNHQSH